MFTTVNFLKGNTYLWNYSIRLGDRIDSFPSWTICKFANTRIDDRNGIYRHEIFARKEQQLVAINFSLKSNEKIFY